MKKKILSLGIVAILMIMLVLLTGCGNSSSNTIIEELNSVVNAQIDEWKEKGYGTTLTVYAIQNGLDKNNSKYVIVASGDKEFTKAPTITQYEEKDIEGYDGNSYSQIRMMEKSNTVNYLLVFDSENNQYYSVKSDIQEVENNGVKKEYPVFSNAKELK